MKEEMKEKKKGVDSQRARTSIVGIHGCGCSTNSGQIMIQLSEKRAVDSSIIHIHHFLNGKKYNYPLTSGQHLGAKRHPHDISQLLDFKKIITNHLRDTG
jgi:hypothetical protein